MYDYDNTIDDCVIGTQFPISAVNEDLDYIDAELADRYNHPEISEQNEELDLDIN